MDHQASVHQYRVMFYITRRDNDLNMMPSLLPTALLQSESPFVGVDRGRISHSYMYTKNYPYLLRVSVLSVLPIHVRHNPREAVIVLQIPDLILYSHYKLHDPSDSDRSI